MIMSQEPTLQCSHRFLTELCTFMPLVCCTCTLWTVAGPIAATLAVGRTTAENIEVPLLVLKAACDILLVICD